MAVAFTALGTWLQRQLDRHNLNRMTAAAQIGIGVGTINQIIRRGHIPKIETLFRFAGFFGTPRDRILRIAADLPPNPSDPDPQADYLIQELSAEFRRIPDQYKPDVLQQVQLIARLSTLPTHRFIADAPPNPHPQEPTK